VEACQASVIARLAASVEQFSKRVQLEAKRLQADDAVDRLERQKRNTRLPTWVDLDGMWNLRGRFEKQRFLAAHALTRLLQGTNATGTTGRPGYVVVIDADTPNEPGPVAEWSIPVDPDATIHTTRPPRRPTAA